MRGHESELETMLERYIEQLFTLHYVIPHFLTFGPPEYRATESYRMVERWWEDVRNRLLTPVECVKLADSGNHEVHVGCLMCELKAWFQRFAGLWVAASELRGLTAPPKNVRGGFTSEELNLMHELGEMITERDPGVSGHYRTEDWKHPPEAIRYKSDNEDSSGQKVDGFVRNGGVAWLNRENTTRYPYYK